LWAKTGNKTVPKPNPIQFEELAPKSAEQERARTASGASVESVSPRRKRKFPATEKLRILKLADTCRASGETGALEAMLRTEGIYSSQLSNWRTQMRAQGAEGLALRKPGRKAKLDAQEKLNVELKKRNAKLERELYILKALVELQKKAHEILGIACPSLEGESL
jgi:transposase